MEGLPAHRPEHAAIPRIKRFLSFSALFLAPGAVDVTLLRNQVGNLFGASRNLAIHLFVLSVKKGSPLCIRHCRRREPRRRWPSSRGYTFLSFSALSLAPGTLDVALLRNQVGHLFGASQNLAINLFVLSVKKRQPAMHPSFPMTRATTESATATTIAKMNVKTHGNAGWLREIDLKLCS